MIESYVQSLMNAVAACPLVRASQITLDQRTLYAGLVREDLFFADGSRLHFREMIEATTELVRRMYSYHYQDVSGALIFRYDDTPHHLYLPNFPHHKHVGFETNVVSSSPPELVAVLQEIMDEHL